MCNIGRGSWNSVNRGKIKATGFIITIFCLTVVSKLLILICVLSFCYKQYKTSRKCDCDPGNSDMLEQILVCEDMPSDECICKDVFENTIKSKTSIQKDGYIARSSSRKTIQYYPGETIADDKSLESEKSRGVRSSATDSAEISFPTDTDETTMTTDVDEEEEEYELSGSCRCFRHNDGVCTCGEETEDYTPSLQESKTSKSKTSTS
ncbi:unnamed protein product [Acanthoscelides obtectus]|uniref:Uncharacterized protein n=1 Tax=Acanthoscelides obtectus TaxID=200917 RepID=A0A9P0JJN0_ACAOB|nr:unnamed protein product [Acanthoscelides obtectus]CAK1634759.1 hypothetical protein AOBTE_LOCUS8891 [Acanthoscelides obtectus]